ncbi:MAG: alkaline phosphatase family protein [Candidatus Poribacteria bacterium]|nr:alkaline phosphatase family protein [Candidatus Poribacteria bacterium]
MSEVSKVALIGLDCVPPEFLFGEWLGDLPHFKSLVERGVHGELASTIPPITVPAWMSMMTSQDPGTLGIYGFRNRRDHSYEGLFFASSTAVKQSPVWTTLGASGLQSVALGVPLTYPPKRMNGHLVSCFLTPDTNRTFTHPASLGGELNQLTGGYTLDVSGFRTNDRDQLLTRLYAMTKQRFQVARHLAETKPWDFFAMVEMGPDRLHHAFWRFTDPEHRLYEAGNPYSTVMFDYYKTLDGYLGELLETLGKETTVFIVSDHGAKRMDGGICLNEWLIRNGYLTLKESPTEPTRFNVNLVDWSKTKVWGDGGYYGRIFLNVEGREPEGIIPVDQVEPLRAELIDKLEALGDEKGQPIGTRVYRPEDIYQEVNGIAPDLIAIFGNLHWRSIGQVGTGSVHVFENDTGPDDANHAENGVLIAAGPDISPQEHPVAGMRLLDIAPTVLDLFGIDAPTDYQGSSLLSRFRTGEGFTQEDEEKIAERLEQLGYL